MITEKVYNLTHSQKTLTTAFAAAPHSSPGELGKSLYIEHHHHHSAPNASGGVLSTVKGMLHGGNANELKRIIKDEYPSQEDLDRAAECGQFGSRPSDLFLKIYHDVLCTLDADPWACSVSPPLLGSRGVVNLSIISV
ncbi:hypothetical protein SERLA73DRAFT_183613 [Serpula lacrymans var. lacrymans S7.3]|uniref:Uncharacterized protein n=2 Tax=Serpula lacrymans var. lacrymans TaxID=341189 RepID=F8Q080_SERL3|nr:uncharacterized protein SERLADRAFT_470886 [Serpula lacrymans var. lacrymans S7.9]EGN98552.1 hypothetical protein SERLA73DRAFT_183613 [Serpula lacrymans var. lacrymans S7.3]EGO24120.1 hypothetical protein SERLADRAFT_470886 [Serpula lacrymans var. lacrymans S7.9]